MKEDEWLDKIQKRREAFNSVMLQCEKQNPHTIAGGRLDSLSYIGDIFLKINNAEVVYVCGPPGTGKTAGVLKICYKEEIEYMNVMTYKTALQWLKALFERMKKRGKATKEEQKCTSEELILKVLKGITQSIGYRVVVVVDEVDNFGKRELSNFTHMLQTLAQYEGLRIIAIANTVNLLQENVTEVNFHQIVCAQYSHQQSMEIVEARIQFALSKYNFELSDLYARDALRKLAMVMQRGEPDVRKLLEIIIEVSKVVSERADLLQMELQEQEIQNGGVVGFSQKLSHIRVRMEDMNDVLNKRYGSVVERVMSKIPKTTKIYAGLVARMVSREKVTLLKQEDTLVQLNRFLKAYQLERVGPSGLSDIITSLQFEGMLERTTKRAKGKQVQMIKMKMNLVEVIEASEDIFKLWSF